MREPYEKKAAEESIGKLYKVGHHTEPPSGTSGEHITEFPESQMPMSGPHGAMYGEAHSVRTSSKGMPRPGPESHHTIVDEGLLKGARRHSPDPDPD